MKTYSERYLNELVARIFMMPALLCSIKQNKPGHVIQKLTGEDKEAVKQLTARHFWCRDEEAKLWSNNGHQLPSLEKFLASLGKKQKN